MSTVKLPAAVYRHSAQQIFHWRKLMREGAWLCNLSRTLKTLERYGIVELYRKDRFVKPVVKATDFHVTFGLHLSHCPAT